MHMKLQKAIITSDIWYMYIIIWHNLKLLQCSASLTSWINPLNPEYFVFVKKISSLSWWHTTGTVLRRCSPGFDGMFVSYWKAIIRETFVNISKTCAWLPIVFPNSNSFVTLYRHARSHPPSVVFRQALFPVEIKRNQVNYKGWDHKQVYFHRLISGFLF